MERRSRLLRMTNRAFPVNGSRVARLERFRGVWYTIESSYLFFSLGILDFRIEDTARRFRRVRGTCNPTNHIKCVPSRALHTANAYGSMRALNLFFACNYFQTSSRMSSLHLSFFPFHLLLKNKLRFVTELFLIWRIDYVTSCIILILLYSIINILLRKFSHCAMSRLFKYI